jgi:hypothetical protein
MSHCVATTQAGLRCKAHHVRGSRYCFWHEPLYEDARKLASMKGGSATLQDMKKKREVRERRLNVLSRLEEALAAARRLGFNK